MMFHHEIIFSETKFQTISQYNNVSVSFIFLLCISNNDFSHKIAYSATLIIHKDTKADSQYFQYKIDFMFASHVEF